MAWPLKQTKLLTFDDYTVAWICALPLEKTAARNMLDELHEVPAQPDYDTNIYTLGAIGKHNVVIVCQGDTGKTAATIAATRMNGTFRRLRFGLLVGIAAGIPDQEDIRLGDVVISMTSGKAAAVVPTDGGEHIEVGKGKAIFESTPFLNSVPELLRDTFNKMKYQQQDGLQKLSAYISQATERNSFFAAFNKPVLEDNLFAVGNIHINRDEKNCIECKKQYEAALITRPPRPQPDNPTVHFGPVASGSQVVNDSNYRAQYAKQGILAIEMEAASLMDVFGCATIRGICDYADSHNNDGWQKYAAATAAACAKDALHIITSAELKDAPIVPIES
ncbi:nucleoside phosphorylase domain-containing protein [Nemania serpens]|nr:nucleoside phosphorylase domain-containing protein [Nemania serpens]